MAGERGSRDTCGVFESVFRALKSINIRDSLDRTGLCPRASCCGIVGCLGVENAYEFLSEGVQILQNRGYDSAGICTVSDDGAFKITKYASSGIPAIDSIQKMLKESKGKHEHRSLGIAHTRWATHGAKTDENAHPHTDSKGLIALVHNGTISNYRILKEKLEKKGIKFKSETDTEVIAQLIGDLCKEDGSNFEEAVNEVVRTLEGTWGLVVIHNARPDLIMVSRHGSPLIIGLLEGKSVLIASEPAALSKYTKEFVEADDMETIALTNDGIGHITAHKKVFPIVETEVFLTPAPWKHWTQREIDEQPKVILRALLDGSRLYKTYYKGEEQYTVRLGGLSLGTERLLRAKHLVIAGCGTSMHAGMTIESFCRKFSVFETINVVDASDFTKVEVEEFMSGFEDPSTVCFLVISQSGETLDLLTMVQCLEKQYPSTTLFSIINVVGSKIARATGLGVYVNAGREVGVASTKAFVCQFVIGCLIAIWFTQQRFHMTRLLNGEDPPSPLRECVSEGVDLGRPENTDRQRRVQSICEDLTDFSKVASDILLEVKDFSMKVALLIKDQRSLFILGKGLGRSVALEGALKIKEISYMHAEGYAAGALKHGPFALLDEAEKTPVILLMFDDHNLALMKNTAEQVKGRGSNLIILTDVVDRSLDYLSDLIFVLPNLGELTPILAIFPLQQLALDLCLIRGYNPDKPRGLAKTVTVW